MSLYRIFRESIKSLGVRDYTSIKKELASNDYVFENFFDEFSRNESFKGNIADFVFRTLAENPTRIAVVDYGVEYGPKKISSGMLLALSIEIAKYIKANVKNGRIAVALQPGILSYAVNIGIILSNNVPVNINFSLGNVSVSAALEKANCKFVFSSEYILKKVPNFSPKCPIIDIAKVISDFKGYRLLKNFFKICLLPIRWLIKIYNVPQVGNDNEAVLLFSSGTTGAPKGIPFSHKNIIGNCLQLSGSGIGIGCKALLSCLPIFHSFGLTVNMWFALIMKLKVVTVGSPLEYKKIANAIYNEKVDVLVSAPTFLRPYIMQVDREKLKSLKYVIVGAERIPVELSYSWENKFGSSLLAGYGLTESSPVVSVNYPSLRGDKRDQQIGSVGRLLPGIAIKFIGPETGKVMPLGERGVLCVKGVNVFKGYLDDNEKTAEILNDGWLITKDLACFTSDGFLRIDGRVSRFSKIGGEMVPHEGVEEAIIKVLDIRCEDCLQIAVVARVNEKKGEKLSLLTTVHIEQQELTSKMLQAGYSSLWIPKEIINVNKIPVLATGKLDIVGCKNLLIEKLELT